MKHILIVEDDVRVADLLQRSLEEQSYSADIAYDGYMGKKTCIG
jgi:DNA-binding response OmpR family regulator